MNIKLLLVEIEESYYYLESVNSYELDRLLGTLFFLGIKNETLVKIINYINQKGNGMYDIRVYYNLEKIEIRKRDEFLMENYQLLLEVILNGTVEELLLFNEALKNLDVK